MRKVSKRANILFCTAVNERCFSFCFTSTLKRRSTRNIFASRNIVGKSIIQSIRIHFLHSHTHIRFTFWIFISSRRSLHSLSFSLLSLIFFFAVCCCRTQAKKKYSSGWATTTTTSAKEANELIKNPFKFKQRTQKSQKLGWSNAKKRWKLALCMRERNRRLALYFLRIVSFFRLPSYSIYLILDSFHLCASGAPFGTAVCAPVCRFYK